MYWAGNSPSKSFESEKIREIKTEELQGREMTDSQRFQIENEGIHKTLLVLVINLYRSAV